MSVSTVKSSALPGQVPTSGTRPLLWCALLVSLAALGGSLFLSIGMNLKACPLCFYQRTFVMSLFAVLATGLLLGGGRNARIGLLTLPVVTAGLGVAIFHVYLEAKGSLECPVGVFGLGSAPQQSLAMFLLLFILLGVDTHQSGTSWVTAAGAVLVGALLAVASCTSNPPMPAPPSQPYPAAPEICRPPFRLPS